MNGRLPQETGTLWIHSVSQEILDSTDDTEKKRQEAINEVIYTERDFVRDLEYLRDVSPLKEADGGKTILIVVVDQAAPHTRRHPR